MGFHRTHPPRQEFAALSDAMPIREATSTLSCTTEALAQASAAALAVVAAVVVAAEAQQAVVPLWLQPALAALET